MKCGSESMISLSFRSGRETDSVSLSGGHKRQRMTWSGLAGAKPSPGMGDAQAGRGPQWGSSSPEPQG